MEEKELVISKLKNENLGDNVRFGDNPELIFSFETSNLTYNFNKDNGTITLRVDLSLIIDDYVAFVDGESLYKSNHRIYDTLKRQIDTAIKRIVYTKIKEGIDPLDLQIKIDELETELKRDLFFRRSGIEVTSVILSSFNVKKNLPSNGKKNKSKKLVIMYIIAWIIVGGIALAGIIWFYKYFLQSILDQAGI